jgi:glycosyltransferase involved in cell wall biosynthesis
MRAILQEVADRCTHPSRVGEEVTQPPRRLRVLQVIDSLTVGGAEQLLLTLARSIDTSAFDLRICSLAPLDEASPIVQRLRALETPLYSRGGVRLWNPLHAARLVCLIRRHEIHVVHTHLGTANTIGCVAGALARRPVVSTLHSVHDVYPRFGAIKQYLQNQALRRCAGVIIACAPEVLEAGFHRLHLPRRKLLNVSNGIDTDACIADPMQVAIRRAALLDGHPGPLVVSVGNVLPTKGHQFLIEAVTRLRGDLPGLRVVIAGRRGSYAQQLEARIAALDLHEQMVLAGRQDDVATLLGAADLFVQPSVFEGLPLSLLEAMAAGTPVVATAVGGMQRLVEDGITGRLVAAGDPVALAGAMLDLLDDRQRALRLALAGQERVRNTHGARTWAHRLQRIYAAMATGEYREVRDATRL